MDTKELRSRKKAMEEKILETIRSELASFTKDTGLSVSNLTLSSAVATSISGERRFLVTDVTSDVNL